MKNKAPGENNLSGGFIYEDKKPLPGFRRKAALFQRCTATGSDSKILRIHWILIDSPFYARLGSMSSQSPSPSSHLKAQARS